MKMRKVYALACLMALAPPGAALSLRSPAKVIRLERLQVGRTYTAEELLGGLKFVDTGQGRLQIVSNLLAPPGAELQDGYEPIPSLSWIRLDKPRIEMDTGQEAEGGFVLKLPDKSEFKGRQYQAQWISLATDSSGASIRLSSRILMDIEDDSDAAFEHSEAGSKSPPGHSFALLSTQTALKDVPLGPHPDLLNGGDVAIKILNSSDQKEAFVLQVERQTKNLELPSGFEIAPNPHFLDVGKPIIDVGAGRIGITTLRFKIPDQARYRGRRWAFIVEVKELGSPDSEAQDFVIQAATAEENLRQSEKQ